MPWTSDDLRVLCMYYLEVIFGRSTVHQHHVNWNTCSAIVEYCHVHRWTVTVGIFFAFQHWISSHTKSENSWRQAQAIFKNWWYHISRGMHTKYYSTISPVWVLSGSHAPNCTEPSIMHCSHVFFFYLMMPSVWRVIAFVAYKWSMSMEHWCWWWKTQVLGEKPVTGLICAPKIQMDWHAIYQTLTSKMRSQELTIWTTVALRSSIHVSHYPTANVCKYICLCLLAGTHVPTHTQRFMNIFLHMFLVLPVIIFFI